jgi:two-component system, chemotaxis family, chemotaxis protein CheY
MRPLNCLIVDDSSVMRRLVRRTMELTELPIGQVHEAGNGREALALLDVHSVDIVFTDINMPVMNGAELLRELLSRTDDVRARVVISTDGSDARRAEVEGLEVDWYLEKPLRPEVMRDVLSRVAERIHV